MNNELTTIIKLYATAPDRKLNNYLLDKSKNNLIAVLVDLITMYINDKNSSTLRELLTVTLAGYKHTEGKTGYNGYRQSVYGKPLMCEAKPKNVENGKKRKLNGGGNFTDYTFSRLERDLGANLNMLVSGFVNGKLIYILEFPFNCETFVAKLRQQLSKRFPKGDVVDQFLRSASFSYRDFIKCNGLKVIFCLKKSELKKYKNSIVGEFYEFLVNGTPHA